MSSADFRNLFNNPAFRAFYAKDISGTKTDDTSLLGIGRQESKSFIGKTTGDFILSKEQLTEYLGSKAADDIFSAVQTQAYFSDIGFFREVSGQQQIVFPNIKFASATKKITRFLDAIGQAAGRSNIAEQIEVYFLNNPQDVGHIFGFSNTLLQRVKVQAKSSVLRSAESKLSSAEKIGDPAGITEAKEFLKASNAQLEALDAFIDSMTTVLEEYDIATSAIKGLDLEVNAKYRKSTKNWAFTWEGSAEQQKVGGALTTVLGKIGQTKLGGKGVRGLFATLSLNPSDKIVTEVLTSFIQEFVDKSISAPDSSALNLLKQRSSPTFIDLLESQLKQALGVKNSYQKEYVGSAKLKPIPLVRVKKEPIDKQTIAGIASLKAKVKATKANIAKEYKKIEQLKIARTTVNLTSLQNLLNSSLVERVKQNMGSGNRKDVLNLQSGRFAESVKVERLSESRQGLISAFYTYMRNPYATFSDGGRQQSPKSRDPKLLISKSIREIAQQQVSNRLRAVLV
jgi:hypothetical protein